jgi:glycosyltransferase involved in cell wall biosynthesis
MNINFSSPINSTGYGIASLNILKELDKNNTITYFPISNPMVDNQEDHNLISKVLNNLPKLDINAPYVKIWHQFDLLEKRGRGPYYAMSFFELDTLNQMEKLHLGVPDSIFVTSEWAKRVLENNGIKQPIGIVPLGVDTNIFNPNKIQKTRKDDKYIFLNIGKWEIRKGHDILLDLFTNAFPNETDVELWILASETTNSYSSKQEIDQWRKKYNHPNIKLFNGFQSHQEIAYLIAESDCGIYPSRAEGWNLELLESMSMNKPVIATNYSAHTEFCNNNNSFLIDIDETELAIDNKAFKGQGNWAKIGTKQKDQCIAHMRHCYNNRIRTNPNGIETAKIFSWKNSSDRIMGYISE